MQKAVVVPALGSGGWMSGIMALWLLLNLQLVAAKYINSE